MEFPFLTYRRLLHCAMILLVASLASCTERIEINTRDAAPHLVIYGRMTSVLEMQMIRITRSAGFFSGLPPEGISGAEVTITSDNTFMRFLEDSSEPGTYRSPESTMAVPGKTYTLDVKVDFYGDGQLRHYTATSYTPEPARIEGIGLASSDIYRNTVTVFITAELPRQTDNHYFSIHVWRDNRMMDDSLGRFTLFNSESFTGSRLVDVPCFLLDQENPDSRLLPGDYITVGLDAITDLYADFLTQARSESSASIPFFSGPPANVITNITPVDPNDKTPLAGFFTTFSRSMESTTYIVE